MDKKRIPLLQNLTEEELASIEQTAATSEQLFEKNEVIFHAGEMIREIGIVESGSVLIESNDLWGNCSILSKIMPGQVFAESYALSQTAMMVDAIATEKTKVFFLNTAIVLDPANAGKTWQSKLLRSMLAMTSHKNITLSNRIFCTTPKTIRARLATYFAQQQVQAEGLSFDVPFTRQQMADYLNLDRSALSKELGKMRDEGMLTFDKNHFVLSPGEDWDVG